MTTKRLNTAVIEGRCDIRDLATLHEWLSQRGVFVNTRSSLFGEIVGQMAELVRGKLGGREFNTNDANNYLTRVIGGANRSGRGRRTLSNALTEENANMNFRDMAIAAMQNMPQNEERILQKQDMTDVYAMLRASGTLEEKKEGGTSNEE
jgi:hypothetical protein